MYSKKVIIITICLLAILVLTACEKDSEDDPTQMIQQTIDQVTDSVRLAVEADIGKSIPTLNIFIQTPEGSWFSSSAGAPYLAISKDSYFRFASNSKNFTAAAVLNMQEDGWLDINSKIIDTIPGTDIPFVPATAAWDIPYKDQITITMLLNHSAGVYDVDNDTVPGFGGHTYTEFTQNNEPNHQFTAEEMVNQAAINQLSYFEPGTDKHYSNTGYAIAGEIVARVYSAQTGSEKQLTDYLYDFIYGPGTPVPLDMHFPYLATDQDLYQPASCGYILGEVEVIEICSYNMSAQVAEGNGFSTMSNLNTYIRSMQKGENVLTAASIEMMRTYTSTGDPNYGLGCFYKKNLGYGHNGARIGNLSQMMYDPLTDVSVVTYISAINDPDFTPTFMAITDLAYAVREALGYPGKP